MNSLPPYQPRKLAEGRYQFTISKEPDKIWRGTEPNRFIVVTFFFKAEAPNGTVRNHTESIRPFDDKYQDMLYALGGKEDETGNAHLSEMIDIIGKQFYARIKHDPDKDDPTKTWARIIDIEIPEKEIEDVPPPAKDEEDPEVPF